MIENSNKSNENADLPVKGISNGNIFSFDLNSDEEDYDEDCEDLDGVSVDTPTYARNGSNKSSSNKPGQPVPTSVPSELLLRLFESNFFDVGMAIKYLFESNNQGIYDYLKGRMSSFEEAQVDFYLPQLITLWHTSPELKETLNPYLIGRCHKSLDFAINVSWLLQTFEDKNSTTNKAISQSTTDLDFSSIQDKTEPLIEGQMNHSKSVPQFNRFIPESMDQNGNENEDSMSISSNQSIFSSNVSMRNSEEEYSLDSEDRDPSEIEIVSESNSSTENKVKNEKCSLCCLRISNYVTSNSTASSPQPKQKKDESLSTLSPQKKHNDIVQEVNGTSTDPQPQSVHFSPQNGHHRDPSSKKNLLKHSKMSMCQCECHNGAVVESIWQNSLIKNEFEFMNSLFVIGRHLTKYSSKEKRTSHLLAELAMLNLKLPSRVWLPVCKKSHIVLRIPPNSAVCLNSKDRAPYLVFVEVLECKNPQSIDIPSKSQLSSCATSISSLNDIDLLSRLPNALKRQSNMLPERLTCFLNSIKSKNVSERSGNMSQYCSTEDFTKLQSLSSALAIAAPDSVSMISTESSTDDLLSFYQDQLQNFTCQINPNGQKNGFIYERPAFIPASDVRKKLIKYADNNHRRKSFKADPEDPSAEVLKEPWSVKCSRIQEKSPWGHLPEWKLISAIVKVGDDLRQEQLAYQLLRKLQSIWEQEDVDLWLRPLEIIVFGSESGLIEPVPDTVSFHQIRRHAKISLLDYMIREHGSMNSKKFIEARNNFIKSCAAYCLVGYLFQVKDRHNGNILLDNEGHLIHIDYGFMLSSSPGKNFGFESSPFKLTQEQAQVMGGINSESFEKYKKLILRGLIAARKHMDDICLMVEIQRKGYPKLPCFARGKNTVEALKNRFLLTKTEDYLVNFVNQMVEASLHSITTKLYDSFQYYTNGIQ